MRRGKKRNGGKATLSGQEEAKQGGKVKKLKKIQN